VVTATVLEFEAAARTETADDRETTTYQEAARFPNQSWR
jgi:hypothetical protein